VTAVDFPVVFHDVSVEMIVEASKNSLRVNKRHGIVTRVTSGMTLYCFALTSYIRRKNLNYESCVLSFAKNGVSRV
jgi:hypothetical protein